MGAWDIYNKSLNDTAKDVDAIQKGKKPIIRAKGLPEVNNYGNYVKNGGVWTEDKWNEWNSRKK